MQNQFKKNYPIYIIFGLALLFFMPALLQGKTFYAFDILFKYYPWASYIPNYIAHNSLISDPVNLYYPLQKFFIENCKNNLIPLWNNNLFCGVPISTTIIISYLNPIVAICCFIFPPSIAQNFILLFHVLFAGLFTYLYLRQIGLNSIPSIIGAICWMFNGYSMVWLEFRIIIILAAYLPLALFSFEKWLKHQAYLYLYIFVCAILLSLTSSFNHGIIFQFLFIGIYILYRLLSVQGIQVLKKLTKKQVLNILFAFILTLIFFGNSVFSSLILLNESQRKEYSLNELYKNTGQLPKSYLATLIFPDLFGSPTTSFCFTPRLNKKQVYNNYNEICIFAGTLTIFLILACVPHIFSINFISFYFIICISSITIAMGSLLIYPLIKIIPGFACSTPTRILYLTGFSFSILAAIGSDIILSINSKKNSIIFLWTILLLSILLFVYFLQTKDGIAFIFNNKDILTQPDHLLFFRDYLSIFSNIIFKPLILCLVSFVLLMLVILTKNEKSKKLFLSTSALVLAFDLMFFGLLYNTKSHNKQIYPVTNAIKFLKKDKQRFRIIFLGKFLHNSFAPFGIEDAGGYSSFYPKRYGNFLHVSQNNSSLFPKEYLRWIHFNKIGSPLLNLLNIKYLLLPPSDIIRADNFRLVYNNEIKIYENLNAFPRVFFTKDYEYFNTQKQALLALKEYSNEDFKNKVILESLPDFFHTNNIIENSIDKPQNYINDPSLDYKIKILNYSPNSIKIDISTNKNGFLVLGDNYHKKWRAYIDGNESKVLLANYTMRAIYVEKGRHEVIFKYHPKNIFIALIVNVIIFILILSIIPFLFCKKKYPGFFRQLYFI